MDSIGLAKAITTYWTEKYPTMDHNAESGNPLPIISSAGIQRRIKRALSSRSARAWLLKLGWNWKEVKKGVYKDGHEREDVKEYRDQVFLPRMQALQTTMIEWDGDLQQVPKNYASNKPTVFITHDECTFDSNEGRKRIWIHNNTVPIRKKDRGQGLHVSDYLTPIGRQGDGNVCEILKCGGDIWWTGDKMLKQLTEKAIPAFETAFPGCQGIFAFDNAKIHHKYAANALQVANLNLTPGGKHSLPMRNGYFTHPDNPSIVQVQSMMLPNGQLKGLKIILQERGLWPNGQKFLTQCSIPGDLPGERKANPACRHAVNANCCARALLSSQPDFQSQKCQLQETIEAAGHQIIFYPSFHCELNFIEYFWGRAKVYTRAHCGYTFPSLVRTVPLALAQIPDVLVWKYYQRTLRMMDAYRNKMVYDSVDFKRYVYTRYSSHRRITELEVNVE